jgi:hypothetical protein
MRTDRNHLLIAIAFTCSSCLLSCVTHTYITRPSAFAKAIETGKKDKSYLVMHSGVDIYKIKSVEVEKSKEQFTVLLDRVDSLHMANMNNPKSFPEKLVHIRMKDSTSYTLDEPHTIPLTKVARIEVGD